MEFLDFLFFASLLGAVLMAFSLGANDAANSMASAVGARAITLNQAIFIAGIMNFVGATLLGAAVTSTVAKGIIDPNGIADAQHMALGMFAALLAAGLFVLASTLLGLPVSSSHAIVGAIAGFGVMAAGWGIVNWEIIVIIGIVWVVTPFFAALIAYLIARLIRVSIFSSHNALRRIVELVPFWMAASAMVVAFFLARDLMTGQEVQYLEIGLILMVTALLVYIYGYRMMVESQLVRKSNPEETVQQAFRRLQVFTSGYISLAHGSNDVANAFGPVLAIYLLSKEGFIPDNASVPLWVLIVGGAGIAAGIGILGQRVIKTVGDSITRLDNVRGFSADFTIATTVMGASQLGIPVSSSHAAVGAVTGTGFASGDKRINFGVLGRIFVSWVITVPVAGVVSGCLYWLMAAVLL